MWVKPNRSSLSPTFYMEIYSRDNYKEDLKNYKETCMKNVYKKIAAMAKKTNLTKLRKIS